MEMDSRWFSEYHVFIRVSRTVIQRMSYKVMEGSGRNNVEDMCNKFRLGMSRVERFTIRTKPKNGESLTGFLIRIGNLNRVSCSDIFNFVKTTEYDPRYKHHVDKFPTKMLHLAHLSE